MTYLNPNLTPIQEKDLLPGDIYLVAAVYIGPDPDWVERLTWPDRPTRDPGYHPHRYLLRRPVKLVPGQMGTATLLDGQVLPGYVNSLRQFIHLDEDGKSSFTPIFAGQITAFTPARAPQPADPALVEDLAAHIMLGLEVADDLPQARRITSGKDHQARRYQAAALAAHTYILGGKDA